MKNKVVKISLIIILIVSGALIYFDQVVVPVKVKPLIIQGLEDSTHKKVSLESLHFNIFKGLVLKNLKITEGDRTILSLKEGSCVILFIPFFKKSIIIPAVKLHSLTIFLQRKADKTFNLTELFTGKARRGEKNRFNFFIYQINVRDSRINFQDETLKPAFTTTIEKLNLNLHLALPASVKFNLKCEIPSKLNIKIDAQGKFEIAKQELNAKVTVKDLSPGEFITYYQGLGIEIPEGVIDSQITLDLKSKQLKYSGVSQVKNLEITKLKVVEKIDNINGEVKFDNNGIFADKLKAFVLGIPVEANFKLTDFQHPSLSVNLTSNFDLAALKEISRKKFNLNFAGQIQGKGSLSMRLESAAPFTLPPNIEGYLDIAKASLKFEKIDTPLENINGRLEFTPQELKSPGLEFKYLNSIYTLDGVLTDFSMPRVKLNLTSKDLVFACAFTIKQQAMNLSKCDGRYLNCGFAVTGAIDFTQSENLNSDLNASLDVNLEDLKFLLKKLKDPLDKIKPRGLMHVQSHLVGNLKNIKGCLIQAKLSSSDTSLYGLKTSEFLLDYSQVDGLIDVPLLYLSLYDGTIQGSAKVNLTAANLPYWINVNAQGVKIEKLKQDTAAKEQNISGTIQLETKINGSFSDPSKISGAGKISILDGKLWELDLFKGLGKLLFVRDFTNIVFHEANCEFMIQNQIVSSENLNFKSSLVNINGPMQIGFDGSLDGQLDLQIAEDIPLTGTFKDVTTALMGQTGRFGVIKVSGTLREPKYKFKPAVMDIIKGLKKAFLKEE